jgi:large subunit ribosomal protein L10
MSKYLKQLISNEIASRLEGVDECVLADVIGIEVNDSVLMRRQLAEKNIELMVVKNSLARRATEGTALATAFEGMGGSLAICWGGDDFITLIKEVAKLDKDSEQFEAFKARGGVMDGEQLTPEAVKEISSWPTRQEQLSILIGQILGVGSQISSQLLAPGGLLSSQLENFPEGEAAAEADPELAAEESEEPAEEPAEEPEEPAAEDTANPEADEETKD